MPGREEETRAAREFANALDAASEELANLRRESGSSSRATRSGGQRVVGTISEIVQLVTATSFVVGAAADRLREAGGILGEFGAAVSDATAGLQAVAQVADIFGRAQGEVVGQLEPFALAGLEVPQEAIDRAAAVSARRQQRAARVRVRAGRATANALADLGYDAVDDFLGY